METFSGFILVSSLLSVHFPSCQIRRILKGSLTISKISDIRASIQQLLQIDMDLIDRLYASNAKAHIIIVTSFTFQITGFSKANTFPFKFNMKIQYLTLLFFPKVNTRSNLVDTASFKKMTKNLFK